MASEVPALPMVTQRNLLVGLLAAIYPAKLARTNIEGWDPQWHWCVYVETPAGQVSFHIHDEQFMEFGHVPVVDDEVWDGHDDATKWLRIRSLTCNPEIGA